MMKFFLLLFVFGIGAAVGAMRANSVHQKECNCPKDLSVALKGCELVASEVNNQLSECEYKLTRTEEARNQCAEGIKEIIEGLRSPGKTMRKP